MFRRVRRACTLYKVCRRPTVARTHTLRTVAFPSRLPVHFGHFCSGEFFCSGDYQIDVLCDDVLHAGAVRLFRQPVDVTYALDVAGRDQLRKPSRGRRPRNPEGARKLTPGHRLTLAATKDDAETKTDAVDLL